MPYHPGPRGERVMQVETSRCPYLRTALMVLLIAVTYCITGKLGLLLAIPPG